MQEYNLLWYSAVDIFHSTRGTHTHLFKNKPGFNYIRYVIQFFGSQISMMDRTEIIKMPINCTILPFLKLPEFKKVNTNFEELCEKRARLLLDKAISTNRKLTIMYSGGIDSTLIMVSLLKIATDKELKETSTYIEKEEKKNILQAIDVEYFKDNCVNTNDKHQLGFIAQEVREVYPKAVEVNKMILNTNETIDDILTLNTTQIDYTLYGAVKNLIEKIDNIDIELENLGSNITYNKDLIRNTSNIFSIITSNISITTSNIFTGTSNISITTSNISIITSNIFISTSNIPTETSNIPIESSNIPIYTSNILIESSNIPITTSNIPITTSNISIGTSNISIN